MKFHWKKFLGAFDSSVFYLTEVILLVMPILITLVSMPSWGGEGFLWVNQGEK